MKTYDNNCSAKRANTPRPLVIFSLILLATALIASPGFAANPWNLEIDAAESNIVETYSFDNMQTGFTYVVPPDIVRQYCKTEQTESGWMWTLQGVELSTWQAVPTPPDARYLLDWRFEYEGVILEGEGRTGFIFGNPENANLMSIEVTRAGSLQLLSWGKDARGTVGRIIWSKKVIPGGRSPIKIEADYDIGQGVVTCIVNGGKPIRIELDKYTSSGPMTIKAVGFFAAVPEARIISGTERRSPRPEHEIDLSSRKTSVEHRRLAIYADNK